MKLVRVPAFAKINLTLAVLWKRDDGFHDIATVFQTIDLCDWLEIAYEPRPSTEIAVSATLPIPGENIAAKAARKVLDATGCTGHIKIHIEKHIPLGGGLGGSSTDGSSVLLALPKMLGVSLAIEDRERIGAELGSDVNFFLHGGTAAAFGRGDQLDLLPDLATHHGYLVTPGFPIDSGAAYRALNRGREVENNNARARFRELLSEIESAPLSAWATKCVNDFETVAFSQYPALGEQLQQLVAKGATLARMSGSGSSLFALYEGTPPALPHRPFQTLSRRKFAEAWQNALASLA